MALEGKGHIPKSLPSLRPVAEPEVREQTHTCIPTSRRGHKYLRTHQKGVLLAASAFLPFHSSVPPPGGLLGSLQVQRFPPGLTTSTSSPFSSLTYPLSTHLPIYPPSVYSSSHPLIYHTPLIHLPSSDILKFAWRHSLFCALSRSLQP